MSFLDSASSTRRWLTLGLTLAGVVAGAVFGVVLTRIGKIVTGAPPATLGNYARNAVVLGVIAGIVSPLVSWTALRRVPLWRTIVEPLAYALAGGAAAVVLGTPVLLLALPPAGLALGFFRLNRRYSNPHVLPSTGPANER
jgi:predicted transporter